MRFPPPDRPVWFPLNYLLIEALRKLDDFSGESMKVACPIGSDRVVTLREAGCRARPGDSRGSSSVGPRGAARSTGT